LGFGLKTNALATQMFVTHPAKSGDDPRCPDSKLKTQNSKPAGKAGRALNMFSPSSFFPRRCSRFAGLLVALLVFGAAAANAATSSKPNVVIFLADDQGWGDLSITGNTNIQTPNIDSIGRGGAVFDRFFVCAVCAPTRAEFLTGRYHSRGGVRGVSTGEERLNTDERTIADAFKAAGYATGAFGKWHNGSQWPYHPNARGFDEYYGFTSGHWAEYIDALVEHNGQPVRGKGYIADNFTDRAIAFIERNQSKPFFCYVPYNTPHSPFTVPEQYWNKWKDRPIEQRGQDGANEDIAVTRCVLAMTENLDYNIGRVLRRLDELKLSDNTIVIYFSDNGPNSFRWNGGMKGRKGSVDEGGVRSPFMIRWPGRIKPGTNVKEIAGAIDILPTLAQFAGVAPGNKKPLDGKDLSPLLTGNNASWPDRMIFSHQNGNVSVRTQQYRLDQAGALFDLTSDPGQKKNIAAEKADVAAKLSAEVAKWRTDVLGSAETKAGGGKKKLPDGRPFPVGYPEFPMTPLPARDGIAQGGVERSANAPNASFFTNWKSTSGRITWDVAVHTTGDYDVVIDYTCPEPDAGSTIELSFNGAKVAGKVTPAWNPPFMKNQDTLPRPKGESPAKEFRPLKLGTIHLEKGRGLLTLRALEIPGGSVMDVRRVTLTLRKT
jgi:arylsulfatase A-like enzyme